MLSSKLHNENKRAQQMPIMPLLTGIFVIALTLAMSPTSFAETIEIVTYYPAQANMGEANLDAASIGALGDDPGPGELFVENRVRIGEPGLYDPADAKIAMFSPVTNVGAAFLHMHVTDPIPTSQTNQDLRALTISKRNSGDNARLDWTVGMNSGDTPGLFFFRALRPDAGPNDFETPLTLGWDNKVGISNNEPEAMLHIGNANKKGDILLENPRSIMFRAPPFGGQTVGTPQQVLSYTTYPNVLLSNNHPDRGGVVISANNDDNTGQIMLRTGLDNPNTSVDEALRMQITNTGEIKIIGNLEIEGAIKQSGMIYAGNGDTNGSGTITAVDALLIINLLNNGGSKFANEGMQERADYDGNGIITGTDVLAVIDIINTRGNGATAESLPRLVDRATLPQLGRHLVVDTSSNLGVGVITPRGGPYNNSISQPDGNNSGIINAHDVYLRATGQWLSQAAAGGGNMQLGTNGYAELPGGLIIQWGQVGTAGSSRHETVRVTFPKKFPNTCFQVVATSGDINRTGGHVNVVVGNIDDDSFDINMGPWEHPSRWIAIGH